MDRTWFASRSALSSTPSAEHELSSTHNNSDHVLGLHTSLQKFDLTQEEIDALRQWNFSRPVWLEEKAKIDQIRAAANERRTSDAGISSSRDEDLITASKKRASLTKSHSFLDLPLQRQEEDEAAAGKPARATGLPAREGVALNDVEIEPLDPKQDVADAPVEIRKSDAKDCQSTQGSAAASRTADPDEVAMEEERPARRLGSRGGRLPPALTLEPLPLEPLPVEESLSRASELWGKVRRAVRNGTFMLKVAYHEEEGRGGGDAASASEASSPARSPSLKRIRVPDAILAKQSGAESDVEREGGLGSKLTAIRKGMSMSMFSTRKGDAEGKLRSMEVQTNEDQEFHEVDPVRCLLHDVCQVLGASYAEIWMRKQDDEFGVPAGLGVPPSPDIRAMHVVHGHLFGTDPAINAGSASARRGSDGLMRQSSRRSLRTPSPPTSPQTGQTGQMGFGSSRRMRRTSSGGSDRRRSSLVGSMGILGMLTQDTQRALGAGLSSRLTFTRRNYSDHEMLEKHMEEGAPREELGGEDWKMVLKRLEALACNEQLGYEEGMGLPGRVWANEHALDWTDLSALDPEDILFQQDPRISVARQLFDMSVGVKIMDPTSSFCCGALMIFKTIPSRQRRSNRANFRQLSSQAAVTDMLKNAGKGTFWCMRLQDASKEWSALRGDQDWENRLEVVEMDDTPAERKPMGRRLKRWCWKYLKKFRGQKKNSWQFSLWSFVGTFIAMLAIAAINNGLNEVEYGNYYLFVLINSMGAVSAMLFAAPSSPVVQPRNILGGHVISATSGLLVDYLTNPDFLAVLPEWLAIPLAPTVAVLFMSKLGLIHPPACACSIIYLAGQPYVKNLGWMYLACPILLDCGILLFIAVAFNNLSKERNYPLFW